MGTCRRSFQQDPSKMKIFQVLISSAVVLASDEQQKDPRKFSNKQQFLQGTDKTADWNSAQVQAYLPKLANDVEEYMNRYIPENPVLFVGQRAEGEARKKFQRTAKHLADVLDQMALVYAKPECRKDARKRRDDGSDEGGEDLMKWKIPTGDAAKATNGLFFVHARWVRNELLDNCERQAMSMLRRLDRLREIWRWQMCDTVDNTLDFCDSYLNVPKPRGSAKLQKRYPGTGNRKNED